MNKQFGEKSQDLCNGILLVDKPSGMTSHDVVAKLRRTFNLRKVGHGGTLDPLATGLLIILIGQGTKLSSRFIGSDKGYEGTLCLGVSTDTQDKDGKIIDRRDYSNITREMLETEMKKWTGDVTQTPPMVSAIKKNGTPLYKLARQGKTVERQPRVLHIFTFKLLSFEPPQADFRLLSTKGTYVRTLCADIGMALGCGAMLEKLRRTKCGDFSLEQAKPLPELLDMSSVEFCKQIIPIHEILKC